MVLWWVVDNLGDLADDSGGFDVEWGRTFATDRAYGPAVGVKPWVKLRSVRADVVKSWVKLRWPRWVRAREQGLTLVHVSAQRKRFQWDRGLI